MSFIDQRVSLMGALVAAVVVGGASSFRARITLARRGDTSPCDLK